MQNNISMEIENLVTDALQGVHTCIPGKIDSFDADKCLAVVTPTGQFKTPGDELMDYPQVNDVPVYVLQYAGQKCTIAFPIKEKDECLLFFSEQQLDRFRDGADAKCDLRFDLTNAIALVGLFAQANGVVKDACDDEAIIIDHSGKSDGNSRVTIKKDEQICEVGDDAKVTITENKIVSQLGEKSTFTITKTEQECDVNGSTFTIKPTQQECKVGGVTMTLANGMVSIKGNLEVKGTIDATGNISSSADVESVSRSLSLHEHICTAPGSPTTPIPGI